MKNKLGKTEDLKEYHKNGKLAYEFRVVRRNYSWEKTFDTQGNQTSFKDSDGYSWDSTYDHQGNETSYKDSRGISWYRTFDDQGRVTSFKNLNGVSWERVYNKNGTYQQINLK